MKTSKFTEAQVAFILKQADDGGFMAAADRRQRLPSYHGGRANRCCGCGGAYGGQFRAHPPPGAATNRSRLVSRARMAEVIHCSSPNGAFIIGAPAKPFSSAARATWDR